MIHEEMTDQGYTKQPHHDAGPPSAPVDTTKKEREIFSLTNNTLLVEFTIIPQADGTKCVFATAVSDLDVSTLSPVPKKKVEGILQAAVQWKLHQSYLEERTNATTER